MGTLDFVDKSEIFVPLFLLRIATDDACLKPWCGLVRSVHYPVSNMVRVKTIRPYQGEHAPRQETGIGKPGYMLSKDVHARRSIAGRMLRPFYIFASLKF